MSQIIKPEFQNSDITGRIIGCAMKVHTALGNGFQELIYQRCLSIEFEKARLHFVRELEMPVFYDNIEVGTRRVDFLVEDKVMVELKALMELQEVHMAQTISYLEAYKLPIGLLVNFGAKSLQFKRFTIEHKLRK